MRCLRADHLRATTALPPMVMFQFVASSAPAKTASVIRSMWTNIFRIRHAVKQSKCRHLTCCINSSWLNSSEHVQWVAGDVRSESTQHLCLHNTGTAQIPSLTTALLQMIEGSVKQQ